MPVWPFLMGAAALLTVGGAVVGAWRVPALALIGYIAVRGVMPIAPPELTELAICAVWLTIAAVMAHIGGKVPAFFFALSALTYPALLPFGFRVEYMGIVPIFADGFAIIALLSIGGGLLGMVDRHDVLGAEHRDGDERSGTIEPVSGVSRGGLLAWIADHSLDVARREKD